MIRRMGQAWSDGSFPVADGQVPSHVLSHASPRLRSDSEPPTSWGGHAVTRIPENEEVNVQTSDIQYADWKKSSRASGILREKAGLAPVSAPTTPLSEEPPPLTLDFQPKPKLGRSMSVDHTHLADFSMFPDKFSLAPPPSSQLQLPRSRHSSSGNSCGQDDPTTPTTPLSNMANSFFRSRASSASEAMERRTNEPKVTKDPSSSTSHSAAVSNCAEEDSLGQQLQVPPAAASFRPRSSSYSGRFPFFDFSMIPDKDPHFEQDKSQQRVRRASSTSSTTSSSHDLQPSNVNVVVPDGSSVVAAALTLAASSPDPPPPPPPRPAEAKQQQPSSKAPQQNAPRFTFFDYSLIPDKDPRAFVRTRERKDN